MKILRLTEEIDLSNYTVIIPSVSVGNVGQLTVDLLITTYKFKKVGILWHPAIIPTEGSDPYYQNKDKVYNACELYVNEALKIAAIQIRSGLEFCLATMFFTCLRDTLSNLKVKKVIVLSSSYAHEMHTIGSDFFKYISTEALKNKFQELKLKEVEPDANGKYIIHGSGFGTKLYEVVSKNVDTALIVKCTSEGDNIPDAVAMLGVLIKVVDFKTEKVDNLVWPTSWSHVYGNAAPLELY